MKANELRKKYLEFFKGKEHVILPSMSLVPENDTTTLLTGSGMQPMVPYLLGAKHPSGIRLCDSQRCFRSQDIEEVGDNRHTTFFEMLGNWSLGDYSKKEQIPWIFEFLTSELGLAPKNLYVTVFRGREDLGIPRDLESTGLWARMFESKGVSAGIADFPEVRGMQGGRIFYYDEQKNWWSRAGSLEDMPAGEPAGPDSEMFWDYGEHLRLHENSPFAKQPCHVNCDCGRFIEIGNSVFMEYVKAGSGFERLKQQNVDFGGGLERMLAVVNGQQSVFDSDLFQPMFEVLALSQEVMSETEMSRARVVVDHIRAATFLAFDGVEPSNKDRGYVLRRLLRRAMVYARLLGLKPHWLAALCGQVVAIYDSAYPALPERSEQIIETLKTEQVKFEKTLDKGLKEFEKLVKNNSSQPPFKLSGGAESRGIITGREAFGLYQTYGFPWELTRELAETFGQKIEKRDFEASFKKHQALSRTASAGTFKGGLADHTEEVIRLHTVTHLLNAALRKVLGEQVWQKGSNINRERTRFDFTHEKKVTAEEIKQVEDMVNDWIKRDLTVKKEILTLDKARALGAIGVFGEKYPDKVSVYTVFDLKTGEVVSCEFCGGPHVVSTGIIGQFKIKKEEAISAGVRRIKAVVK